MEVTLWRFESSHPHREKSWNPEHSLLSIGLERYYRPPATLPAERDFANGLYAPIASRANIAALGAGEGSPVPAPTIRPFRSLYPGGS